MKLTRISSTCLICNKLSNGFSFNTDGWGKLKRFFALLERYLDDNDNNHEDEIRNNPFKLDYAFEGIMYCNECAVIVDSFCQLFHQMKVIELKLNWEVWTLKNIMLSPNAKDSPQGVVKYKGDLIRKCSQKLGKSFPLLSLKRTGPELGLKSGSTRESDNQADPESGLHVHSVDMNMGDMKVFGVSSIKTVHAFESCAGSSASSDGYSEAEDGDPQDDSRDLTINADVPISDIIQIMPGSSIPYSISSDGQTSNNTLNRDTNRLPRCADAAVPVIQHIQIKGELFRPEDLLPGESISHEGIQSGANNNDDGVTHSNSEPLPIHARSSSPGMTGRSQLPQYSRNRETSRRKCAPLFGQGSKEMYKENILGRDMPPRRQKFRCRRCPRTEYSTTRGLSQHMRLKQCDIKRRKANWTPEDVMDE